MEFKLFLARHGETDHNKGSVIQGQLDIPLSKNGMNQAKLLAKSIHHLQWNEIWTSDLKRSWQTANFLVSDEINHQDDGDNDALLMSKPLSAIQSDIRIRERHYGICQGQSTANLKKMAGEAGVKISNFVPPEAESSEDVKKRAIAFFKDLCDRQILLRMDDKESKILVVGHGGWLSEFMTYLALPQTGRSSFTPSELEAVSRITPNTAVSSFEIQLQSDGGVSLIKCLALHDKSHLTSPVCSDELAV
ncbi:fructose-2,6-bisphosphatase TIGAR-like [Daphnia pulicaria]|uniref:fructose-2,6-bisphosphatase TIGAR-like n=1 Tax=Daphnia pulicaria TaxID=35523 RepID=UPI001EEBCC90|nr:fructose-2,6-bisphosphatase TIGAR-like [Daphnia pulicaria]